ncbi:long-chain fatty acid--CoA ligase [Roseospira marina]|uniref:Long-chain fatty acid--CoA ligase n=1 Tax=Roseospira marina TaxID=140057 RepID=A0A5M6IGT7_9PROT|nr:long-chain fatty acid--CoA ligase [Roseospira marina]KAA5607117.1 long-chain fatty acid--CoA ligase [Roseospira marina]MBB4312687.1 long-chain acyl-CoA synthetase [Roseospira marina]MBB5086540.1 long-chain acyl-CoA synthetase [Roseospira marina]
MARKRNQKTTPEFGDVRRFDTFPKLLAYNARAYGHEVVMREKEFGIWNAFTFTDYERKVRQYALGLRSLGIERGDCVGLLGANRPEWVWGEVAAHAIGATSLGIYRDALGEEVAYLIQAAQIKAVICEDEEQVDKLIELGDQIPSVTVIVYCDPRGMRKYTDARLIAETELCSRGDLLNRARPTLYDDEVEKGSGEDVSILCTTSGTTSKPKLAMLQSGHFLRHCLDYLTADPKCPGDDYVSVLPLPWIMEQVYVVGQQLIARNIINFVEDEETTMADLREIGPTFVLLAPRVWESIAAEVRARMMDSTPFKRFMFAWGMKIGKKAAAEKRQSWFADLILFRALRDRYGFSFLTSAATGGAAMGPETFTFFHAMGVPLKQLYGQTELAGAYTIHRGDDIDPETVGLPFDESAVRINDPDDEGVGEIVGRSQGMFLGYYKNEAATNADLRDGWLYTGDAGYMDTRSGHLVVIDRVKDLANTATGVRFSPQYIENKLKFSAFVAEAVILGRDLPYLAAMICIRWSIVSKWAEQKGISFTNYTNLSAQPEVYALLREEVERVNDTLPEAQRIRKFLLLYKELDPDDGELTRTRKVRRGVIAEKYAQEIEAIYAGRDAIDVDTTITFQDGSTARIQTTLRVETLLPPDNGSPARQAAE